MHSPSLLPSRLARVLFTALMAFTWSGGSDRIAAQVAAGVPTSDSRPDIVADARQAVQLARASIDPRTFDVAAVVGSVGTEPDKLFEWVRDHTYWAPYRGILRGAQGVLMDRLGNSADRAVLLAALLQTARVPARLARSELTEAQAKELAAAVRPAPPDPLPPQAAAVGIGVAGAGVGRAEFERLAEDASQRAAELSAALTEALGEAPAAAPAELPAWQAMTDHWWVQVERDGQWIAFDPTLPDARPGAAATAARQTFPASAATQAPAHLDPAKPLPADAIPSDLWHEVRVSIVVEQWKAGVLTEARPLIRSLRPALLHGGQIVVRHVPFGAGVAEPEGPQPTDRAGVAERYRTHVLGNREWLPMLEIGGTAVTDGSIKETGEIDPKPRLDPFVGAGKAVVEVMQCREKEMANRSGSEVLSIARALPSL